MKLLSAAALAVYATNSVLASSDIEDRGHTEGETGFVTVTKTQGHTHIDRDARYLPHLESTRGVWTNLKNYLPSVHFQHKREIQATHTSFVTPLPSTITITTSSADTTVIYTLTPRLMTTTAGTSQPPKPSATSTSSDATAIHVSPPVLSAITIPASQKPQPIPTLTTNTTSTPTPQQAFYRQVVIEDACQPTYTKRCRFLANNMWWPAGGKECWCISPVQDPGAPSRPIWDTNPDVTENYVALHRVPAPAQALLDEGGSMIGPPKKAWWMEAVVTKAA